MALNLGMLGMKMETLIQTETVSENMVTLLKNSVPQRHQAVLDVADQRIAVHWEEALSSDGRMPNMERDFFQSIYNVVLDSFHQNGGDAMAGNRVAFWKRSHCKTGQAYAESVALFHILKEENPDFFGWLSIPDTLLDYPVMYTPCDPGYYLRRAFDGDESVSGVPFVGAGYQQNSRHIIIYGHNMKNGNYVCPPPPAVLRGTGFLAGAFNHHTGNSGRRAQLSGGGCVLFAGISQSRN